MSRLGHNAPLKHRKCRIYRLVDFIRFGSKPSYWFEFCLYIGSFLAPRLFTRIRLCSPPSKPVLCSSHKSHELLLLPASVSVFAFGSFPCTLYTVVHNDPVPVNKNDKLIQHLSVLFHTQTDIKYKCTKWFRVIYNKPAPRSNSVHPQDI